MRTQQGRFGNTGQGYRRLAVILASIALMAGACSRSDDAVETGTPETTAASGSGSSTPEAAAAGDFGDLEGVCGPGDGAGTAQGLKDGEIQIGTISDPGFVGRPGLNQELFDATEVFTKWCNDAGGINGIKIKSVERDAALTEYKQRITEACSQDFMLVGGGAVFDETGQAERLGCLLPDIPAYQVSPAARASELAVRPLPTALQELPVAIYNYLGKKFPDSTDKVAFLTGSVASTVFVDAQAQEATKGLGWSSVYAAQYNAGGEASWTPFAEAMKSAGAKGLIYTGEPENLAKLLQALSDIGYSLDWVSSGANTLDQNFVDVGGDAIQNVYIASSVVPPFLAADNPATQQYEDLFAEYLPDGKSEAILGFNSFSAWLLFAESVKSCGSDVTRKCVFDAAKATTEWTGGGLHSASNPGEGKTSECYMIVEASPEGFAIPDDFTPDSDSLFQCSEDNVVVLKADYGSGTTLESVGKSLDDLE